MESILLRSKPMLRHQPATHLDLGHPLTRGLTNVVLLNRGIRNGISSVTGPWVQDLITAFKYNTRFSTTTWPQLTYGANGPGWMSDGSNRAVIGPPDGFCRNKSTMSICAVVGGSEVAGGTGGTVWNEAAADANTNPRLRIFFNAGSWQVNFNTATSASPVLVTLSYVWPVTKAAVVLWCFDASLPRAELYVNGQKALTPSLAGVTAFPDTAPTSNVGFMGTNGTGYTGAVTAWFVWNRALYQSDAAQLTADPFCFFRM